MEEVSERENSATTDTISFRAAIELLLQQTRRAAHYGVYAEIALWLTAAFFAYVFFAIGFALLLPNHGEQIFAWSLRFGVVAGVLTVGMTLFLLWKTYPSLYDIAARLQAAHPDFRSDIVAALQFSEPDADFSRFSESLANKHVEQTAHRLVAAREQVDNLAMLLPTRPLMPSVLASASAVLLVVGLYFLNGPAIDRLLETTLDKSESSTQKAVRSIVGEIDLKYVFPPYANRPSSYESFTTGHIKVLAGTEVTLKTYGLVDAESFELVWTSGEDTRTITLDRTSDRRVQATLNVTKPGSYTFRAIAANGSVLEDPTTRTIEVELDNPPEVVVTSHQGEIEVSPDDLLQIEFTVADDFGIEQVSSATQFSQGGSNVTRNGIDLPSLINIPKSVDGQTRIDLKPLQLQPKDVVVFHIEATDNNSMTGPGVGKSAPLILRVTSPADKHQRLIAAQQEVLDSLIDVLGSYLESPVGEREYRKKKYRQVVASPYEVASFEPKFTELESAHDAAGIVLQVMQKLTKELSEDPLLLKRDYQTFKGIYERLYRNHRNGSDVLSLARPKVVNGRLSKREAQKIANYAGESEHLLERTVLALEDVVKQQKVDAIADTMKEIKEARDRIKELLEKYRESKDPEVKAAILREIQRLKQRMAELLARMQKQVQNLPQDHVNTEALQQDEVMQKSQDIAGGLESIEEMLENDDIDGAMAALDELTKNLEEMQNGFSEDAQEMGMGGGPSALDKELNDLMDKLNDLESNQRSLEQQTRELQLQSEQQRDEDLKKLLEEGLKEIEERVAEQTKAIDELTEKRLARHDAKTAKGIQQQLEELHESISEKDIEQALETSREIEQVMKSLEFSLELSERYARDKDAKQKDIREGRKQLREMVPRGRTISNSLKQIMDQASKSSKVSDPKVPELRKQQRGIERQAAKLQKEIDKSADKFPILDGDVKKSIESAKNDMEKSEGGLKQSKVQRSLDFQRSALEHLQNVKESMKTALEKDRQGNERQKEDEKVAIPKGDSRDARDIRDEVQKRMKDERLERYESEIERYYKSLTE